MHLSHRFGSIETVSRARYWMSRLGFELAPVDPESHDVNRLTVNVDLSKSAAALALINSLEHSDPEGWPGFLTPPKELHSRHGHAPHTLQGNAECAARSPIHWGQRDDSLAAHPVGSKVSEYMLARWE